MSWDRPLGADLPTVADVRRVRTQVLQVGAIEVRDLLEAGTPIRTGRLQGGWEQTPTPNGADVVNLVPYAPYVDIDERPAVRAIRALNQTLSRAINALFRR